MIELSDLNIDAPVRRAAKSEKMKKPRKNQAGRPTLAELERRKATVMEVATELFVTQGYAETSLVDIAKKAGVATRTLYQHFGDKEAIFREVAYARRSASMMPRSTPDENATVFEALSTEAQQLLDYVLADRSVDMMRLMVAESRRFPDMMKKIANATFARLLLNITHMFETLAQRGQIPDGDHAESAQMFADLMLGNSLLNLVAAAVEAASGLVRCEGSPGEMPRDYCNLELCTEAVALLRVLDRQHLGSALHRAEEELAALCAPVQT